MTDDRLDRLLDERAWRAAEALARAGRDAWWWWRARRDARDAPPGSSSRNPRVRALVNLDAAPDRGSLGWSARGVRVALAAGAFGRANALADEVAPRIGELAPRERRAALVAVLDAWLAHGERHRARALAGAHRDDLVATAAGATIAGLLDPGEAPRWTLPGRRINAMAIADAITAGRLGGDDVAAIVGARPDRLLADPQLHLLIASARRADRAASLRSINRFLRAYGVPAARWAGATGHALRDLAFAPGPPVRGPLVSVIVAAHDAAATIEYAIGSLLAQTYQDLEVLVADDASGDGTLDLVRRRFGGDPRVRVYASPRNQGPYNLRNALLPHARGALVTFHDADDVALPTRIEAQVARIRGGAVASYTCMVRARADGSVVFFRDHAAVRLCMVTLMTSPRHLRDLGGFRPARIAADLEMYERLRDRHGGAGADVVRQPLVLALASDTSATRRAGSESHSDGYRSPARRAYADALMAALRRREPVRADDAVAGVLRETGNWAEPAPVTELA